MASDGFFSPRSNNPVHLGVTLVVAGVLLILLTWFKVAELVLVPAQFPLLVSGGLTGIVLVLVGLTMVNVHIKRQKSAKRIAAINRLVRAVGGTDAVADQAATSEAETAEIPRRSDNGWEASGDAASEPVSRSVWG